MFEDKCYEKGVACASCAQAMSGYESFEALRDHLASSGFDGSYLTTVHGMWLVARKRTKRPQRTKRSLGVSKKTSRPDDRLKRIAKAYGVEMEASTSRASVVRACLKKSHPDKKADGEYTEEDKDNHAFLVEEYKAKN